MAPARRKFFIFSIEKRRRKAGRAGEAETAETAGEAMPLEKLGQGYAPREAWASPSSFFNIGKSYSLRMRFLSNQPVDTLKVQIFFWREDGKDLVAGLRFRV